MATRCYNCNDEIGPTTSFALYRSVIEFYEGHSQHTNTNQTVRTVCTSCAHGAAEHATRFPNGIRKS